MHVPLSPVDLKVFPNLTVPKSCVRKESGRQSGFDKATRTRGIDLRSPNWLLILLRVCLLGAV